MQTFLVASALGTDRPGIVFEFAHAIRESGCTLRDSRMAVLGSEFCAQFLVCGNWNAVAKAESALPRVAERLELQLVLRRTTMRAEADSLIP